MANGLLLQKQWFIQDGATSNIANVVLDLLNSDLGSRVVSKLYSDHHNCGHFWPRFNSDLKPTISIYTVSVRKSSPKKTIQ
jgi:hypothetical protein